MAEDQSIKLHGNTANLVGDRFDRLVVISFARHTERHEVLWNCLCECGNTHQATTASLNRGNVRSCGCLIGDFNRSNSTHGRSKTPEYYAWRNIIARCCNRKDAAYHNYGARGITVCDAWLSSFEAFLADMGERPSARHSIERKDNEQGYSPENCEWTTRKKQCRNRRSNRLWTFDGITLCVSEWAERLGVQHAALMGRFHSGWSIEKILTTPVRVHRQQKTQ